MSVISSLHVTRHAVSQYGTHHRSELSKANNKTKISNVIGWL